MKVSEVAPTGRDGFAVASDGAPLYFRVTGAADAAVTVVLSDGIGCDGYVWRYLHPALAIESQVLHWHYRGHGRTPAPRRRGGIGIPELADDLVAVLDAAGIGRAVLAGHSMGVQVCLEAHRRHAERVSGLVLVCGSHGNPLRTFKGSSFADTALPYIAFGVNRAPRLTAALWRVLLPTRLAYEVAAHTEINSDLARVEDFMPYLEHMAAIDPLLFLDLLSETAAHSAKDHLPAVNVPTLIVAGEHDGFTPRSLSDEMAATIPGSELCVIEGGTHTSPIERPELVNERIARFLRERVAIASLAQRRTRPPRRAR